MRLVIALMALVAASCDADDAISPLDADVKSQIAALGFDTTDIQDYGSYVVVEGDIRLEKSNLSRRSPGIDPLKPLRQYSTTALVSPGGVTRISVDLSGIDNTSEDRKSVV